MPHARPLTLGDNTTPPAHPLATGRAADPTIELVAVVVAVIDDEPLVHIVSGEGRGDKLPSARFRIGQGEALEMCLRAGVTREVGLDLGYVEQLPCIAVGHDGTDAARLSIGYLTLAHGVTAADTAASNGSWRSWYQVFPWEDWRRGRPLLLREVIEPRLRDWADQDHEPNAVGLSRMERARLAFGLDGTSWDEERVVERLDLLVEADLLGDTSGTRLPPDHRRTIAHAMARLRSKIKSRPVVFELMPERFTLFELQRTVEAILGPHLHKQNFRRLVEHMGLVEPTEGVKSHTGGRPAKLFRFRQSVLLERLQPGVRVRTARG